MNGRKSFSMCYLFKSRGKSGQPVSLNEICFDFAIFIHPFIFVPCVDFCERASVVTSANSD